MYIFDTNAVIYYLKDEDRASGYFDAFEKQAEKMTVSIITKIELLSFRDPQEVQKAERLIENNRVIDLDNAVVNQTIKIRKNYRLKLPDAIIAATTLD